MKENTKKNYFRKKTSNIAELKKAAENRQKMFKNERNNQKKNLYEMMMNNKTMKNWKEQKKVYTNDE